MNPDLQNIVAALAFFAAVVYLCYSGWRAAFAKQARGCGSGCSTCPSSRNTPAAAKKTVQFITIEPPKADR